VHIHRTASFSFCVLLIGMLAFGPVAHAVPNLINYQGRLTDAAGQAQQGPVTLTFRVYATLTGGSPLWGPQVFANTPLVDGYFNVILGADSNSQAVGAAFGQSAAAYLEIQVGTNPPITPRQQILSAPYAVTSQNADRVSLTTVTKTATSNSPLTGNEDIVYVDGSSGSFTLVLPPAQITAPSPYYGEKVVTIKRIDNSLQFPVSIAGTLDGASDWQLHTQNEAYRIVRNGSEWKILEHYARTPWAPVQPIPLNPGAGAAKGVTTTDRFTWRREGAFAVVRMLYVQVSAGSAGSGAYAIDLPPGLIIDTDIAPVATPGSPIGTALHVYGLDSNAIVRGPDTGDQHIVGVLFPLSSAALGMVGRYRDQSEYYWGANGSSIWSFNYTNLQVGAWARVPIDGWKD